MALIGLRNLCTPAYVYLVISLITVFVIATQNLGNKNVYCLGSYACNTPNTYTIFVLKLIYIVFWTWLLNLICNSGYSIVSWILVLIPYVLMFLMIALMFLSTVPDDGRYTTFSLWAFF
jgi:hypothetical protein